MSGTWRSSCPLNLEVNFMILKYFHINYFHISLTGSNICTIKLV